MSARTVDWRCVAPLLLILLLSAALRLYKIDAQSLWYDEGNSARIAERSLALIIAGAAGDIHPPLYYLLLKAWRAIFGESEAALRSLSACCGVLSVLFTWLSGRTVANERVGLMAAALVAIAPFAVYYGQEARMYALLALCAAASTWALTGLLRNSRWQRAAIYALATAAGLWTQYAYPFVMLAQGIWTVLMLFAGRARARQVLSAYVPANIAAIASFMPWVPVAAAQLRGWTVAEQPYTLGAATLDAYRWLVVGRTLPLDQAGLPLIAVGALALLGAIAGASRRIDRLALALLTALPLTLLLALNLYRDAYLKFLLVCVAPLFTLAALGADRLADALFKRTRLPQWVAAATISALLALALAPSLRNLYDNPAYARDNYRGIQALIASVAGDDRGKTAVLFNAANQWEVYTYYQKNDRDLHPLNYRPVYEEVVARDLESIVFGRPRVFVLNYAEHEGDPNGWYERWLGLNAAKVHEEWIGNIRLALYSGDNPYRTVVENAAFGDAITLVRAEAVLDRADGVVPLRLTWRSNRPLDKRYKIFVHVGAADAPPIAQNDSEPASGYQPTDIWQPNTEVQEQRGVWLKPGAAAGRWSVFVGLYDNVTGERLGERLKIGEVTFG
jgi:mannosyltransferase